jgi:type II secretory pathway pseudopilin PulG
VSREPEGLPGGTRRTGALAAALAVLAIAASGCGQGLKNAVDTARSLQSQGSNAVTQAQQQMQSVQNELQQQATQNQNGGGNSGY